MKTEVMEQLDRRHSFVRLLLALFILLFGYPLVNYFDQGEGHWLGMLLWGVMLALVLVATALAVAISRKQRLAIRSIVVAMLLFYGVAILYDQPWTRVLQSLSTAVFLLYSVGLIVKFTFQLRTAGLQTVSASLCGYLMLGVGWANLYILAHAINADSFNFSDSLIAAEGSAEIQDSFPAFALYYSFITLTTVGFGDITPATDLTRMLTTAEALIGQAYLVVLVARLVGLHVAQSGRTPS